MSESHPQAALVLRFSVPAEGELRMIAADLASRVAEYLGPSLPDRESIGRALDRAAAQVLPAANGAEIAFEFRQMERELRIEARCGTRTSQVSCPLPA